MGTLDRWQKLLINTDRIFSKHGKIKTLPTIILHPYPFQECCQPVPLLGSKSGKNRQFILQHWTMTEVLKIEENFGKKKYLGPRLDNIRHSYIDYYVRHFYIMIFMYESFSYSSFIFVVILVIFQQLCYLVPQFPFSGKKAEHSPHQTDDRNSQNRKKTNPEHLHLPAFF